VTADRTPARIPSGPIQARSSAVADHDQENRPGCPTSRFAPVPSTSPVPTDKTPYAACQTPSRCLRTLSATPGDLTWLRNPPDHAPRRVPGPDPLRAGSKTGFLVALCLIRSRCAPDQHLTHSARKRRSISLSFLSFFTSFLGLSPTYPVGITLGLSVGLSPWQ
jgi:hypothetical protein